MTGLRTLMTLAVVTALVVTATLATPTAVEQAGGLQASGCNRLVGQGLDEGTITAATIVAPGDFVPP